MSSPYKTFSIESFGCKVNFADSSMLSKKLVENGLSHVSFNDVADIYIINTCSVTDNADRKANKFIKNINIKAPLSKIIVTGCYAQLNPEKISNIPGVDLVVGTEDKFNIEKILDSVTSQCNVLRKDVKNINKFDISYSISERTRSFIKVQDGCNYNCTYCTIPNARGRSRNDSIKNTIKKINIIINSGIKEIVLSGINIGDFGNNEENLFMLLCELEKIKNLKRYRISSIEPNLLNNKIINLLSKSNKALPHLHIPLQSGSNRILKHMKRRYSVNSYTKLINKVNNLIPDICIGVDVIVGFPTETYEDFILTYNLLEKLKISYLHVFSFSKRENTDAATLNNIVSKEDIIYRRKILQKLSKDKFESHIRRNLGEVRSVLFEKHQGKIAQGLTDNYIRVNINSDIELNNIIKQVKIVSNNEFVAGKIIE